MIPEEFIWRKSLLTYFKFGEGVEIMLAFHGYGQSGRVFADLEPSLGKKYTVYSFDLFSHGNSHYREEQKFTKADLRDLILCFSKEICGDPEKISLLAFSIGGNYVLSICEEIPQKIDRLIITGIDGLQNKLFFKFITLTSLGKSLFQGFISFPGPAFFLLKAGLFFKILDQKVYDFFRGSIAKPEDRLLLYRRWQNVSMLVPDLNKAAEQINSHQIKTALIFGKRDKVIPVKGAIKFNRKLISGNLIVLDQGHQLIRPGLNRIIEKLLLKGSL